MAVRTSLTALRQQATRVLDTVPALRRLLSELSRIELLDRSLALGAQALLALIPMLMVLGTVMPSVWVESMVQQIRDVVGLREDVMAPIRELAVAEQVRRTETGVIGLVVSLASASAFSRALQRMYARAWELPGHRGVRALRSSLVWILGWLAMLQASALLLRSLAAVQNGGLLRTMVQLLTNTLLWWWTSRLLLGGRVSWRRLLPGAALTALLLVTLTRLSSVFMPPFTRSNLEQFGPLGVVFAVGSWLVLFGGVLVVATVVGRQVSLWWLPAVGDAGEDAAAPSGSPARLGRPGLSGRYAAGQEQRDEGDHGQHEQGRPKTG